MNIILLVILLTIIVVLGVLLIVSLSRISQLKKAMDRINNLYKISRIDALEDALKGLSELKQQLNLESHWDARIYEGVTRSEDVLIDMEVDLKQGPPIYYYDNKMVIFK